MKKAILASMIIGLFAVTSVYAQQGGAGAPAGAAPAADAPPPAADKKMKGKHKGDHKGKKGKKGKKPAADGAAN